MALQVFDTNYNKIVNSDELIVLFFVDFWEECCGKDTKLTPIINELVQQYRDKILIGRCAVEYNSKIVSKFAIENLPTIVFIKDRKLVSKWDCVVDINIIREKIELTLNAVDGTEIEYFDIHKMYENIETDEEREMRYAFGHCAKPYGRGI